MAVEVTERVWWIELSGVNAYLVADDVLTLVDAGMPWDAGDIRTEIRDAGFRVRDVDRVLVTHYDVDHVGGLARLAPDLDATVVAGAADAAVIAGDRRPPIRNHKGALQRVTGLLVRRPDLPIEPVTDGDEVGSFTAYHTPGHTPGHTVYVSPSLDVAMVGDLVRGTDGGLSPSPWVFSYDTGAVRRSIRDLVDRAPKVSTVCPGHGYPLRASGGRALASLVG